VERHEVRRYLENQGAANIRHLLFSGTLPSEMIPSAVQWLRELDEAERAQREASQAEQMRTALRRTIFRDCGWGNMSQGMDDSPTRDSGPDCCAAA